MRIIPANQSQISNIVELIVSCTRTMRANGIDQWDDIYPNEEVITADVNNRSMSVVAEGDAVIAAICLNEEQDASYQTAHWLGEEPVLVVHRLCIDPAHQRKGIGNELMDFAEAYGVSNGYKSIRLDAYTGNPAAIRLYERRGYRKAGEAFFPRRSRPFVLFEKILGTENGI